jgi:2',3'-cyclic-nucleotide 2'-phosphodiesterase
MNFRMIGAEKEPIIRKFITQIGSKKEVARGDVRFSGALVTVDESTGRATAIERVHRKLA